MWVLLLPRARTVQWSTGDTGDSLSKWPNGPQSYYKTVSVILFVWTQSNTQNHAHSPADNLPLAQAHRQAQSSTSSSTQFVVSLQVSFAGQGGSIQDSMRQYLHQISDRRISSSYPPSSSYPNMHAQPFIDPILIYSYRVPAISCCTQYQFQWQVYCTSTILHICLTVLHVLHSILFHDPESAAQTEAERIKVVKEKRKKWHLAAAKLYDRRNIIVKSSCCQQYAITSMEHTCLDIIYTRCCYR